MKKTLIYQKVTNIFFKNKKNFILHGNGFNWSSCTLSRKKNPFTIISMDMIFSSIQRKGYYQESVCVDSDEQTGLSFLRFY